MGNKIKCDNITNGKINIVKNHVFNNKFPQIKMSNKTIVHLHTLPVNFIGVFFAKKTKGESKPAKAKLVYNATLGNKKLTANCKTLNKTPK